MDNTVKYDILKTLQDVIHILESPALNVVEIKELSNHTIHNASIYQDEDSISVAILIYALSKILERCTDNKYCIQITGLLKEAHDGLNKGNIGEYKNTIKRIFKEITKVDEKFRKYVEEVIVQAQIKKGSKIFEHGISIARASEMLGISQWELMSYIGKTSIADVANGSEMTRKRLTIARGLFK